MMQLNEYDTFIDSGKNRKPPDGYNQIEINLIFDILINGKHTSVCVIDDSLTDISVDIIYSGIVSLI